MKHAESDQWREAVQHLLNVRRPEQAEQLVRRRLAQHPQEAAAHELLALALLNQEEFKSEALTVVRTALALDPQSSDAHYFHSIALQRSGQSFAALEAIQEALRLAAFNATYLGYKAVILNGRKQPQAALEAAQAGLYSNPGHLECLYQRIRALQHLQQPEAAALTIQQLVRWHPGRALSHLLLGQEAVRQQQPEAAETHFREALRLDPATTGARQGLLPLLVQFGQQAQQQAQVATARAYFLEAWQLEPDHPEARQGLEWVARNTYQLKRQLLRFDAWAEEIQAQARQKRVGGLLRLYGVLLPLVCLFCLPLIGLYLYAAVRWRWHPDIRMIHQYPPWWRFFGQIFLLLMLGAAALALLIWFRLWLDTL